MNILKISTKTLLIGYDSHKFYFRYYSQIQGFPKLLLHKINKSD